MLLTHPPTPSAGARLQKQLAPAVDFQGQRGCEAPHKIVEFDLDGAKEVVLQLSGAGNPIVHLSVTQVPPTKP